MAGGSPGLRHRRLPVRRGRKPAAAQAAGPRQIAPGVHLLTLGTGLLASNVYFVGQADSWVLIDAGWPHREELIGAAARALFGPGARPAAILLTHIHPDHSGSAPALARGWGVSVWVHPDELPMAPGEYLPRYANPLDRWLLGPLLSLLPARTRRRLAGAASLAGAARPLPGPATVPGLPGWEWRHTPGHTPGHVAFWRPRDRVLITGDAVLTLDLNSLAGLLLRRQRIAAPPRITTWDWPAAKASLAALARLGPLVLAPGHGRPVTGPAAAAALRDFATHQAPAVAIPAFAQVSDWERVGNGRARPPGKEVTP